MIKCKDCGWAGAPIQLVPQGKTFDVYLNDKTLMATADVCPSCSGDNFNVTLNPPKHISYDSLMFWHRRATELLNVHEVKFANI